MAAESKLSGAGLLVVHSMFKEECSYIRPFIVIGK